MNYIFQVVKRAGEEEEEQEVEEGEEEEEEEKEEEEQFVVKQRVSLIMQFFLEFLRVVIVLLSFSILEFFF